MEDTWTGRPPVHSHVSLVHGPTSACDFRRGARVPTTSTPDTVAEEGKTPTQGKTAHLSGARQRGGESTTRGPNKDTDRRHLLYDTRTPMYVHKETQ